MILNVFPLHSILISSLRFILFQTILTLALLAILDKNSDCCTVCWNQCNTPTPFDLSLVSDIVCSASCTFNGIICANGATIAGGNAVEYTVCWTVVGTFTSVAGIFDEVTAVDCSTIGITEDEVRETGRVDGITGVDDANNCVDGNVKIEGGGGKVDGGIGENVADDISEFVVVSGRLTASESNGGCSCGGSGGTNVVSFCCIYNDGNSVGGGGKLPEIIKATFFTLHLKIFSYQPLKSTFIQILSWSGNNSHFFFFKPKI